MQLQQERPRLDERSVIALTERCLSGDERGWEALVRQYAGLINGVAARYGLSEDDRADVFQDICVALWQHLPTIRDPERLAGWLVTTTGRAAWRHEHARQLHRRHASGHDLLESLADQDCLPDELLVIEERWATLANAVEALDDRCYQLIRALYFDPSQPTYTIVARAMGIPQNSLGPTRQRCLLRLRHLLAEHVTS